MGKRQKNLGDRSRKKKRRNLAGNYLGNLQQDHYTDREEKGTKERGKKDGMKTKVDGKIPWNKKT